MHLLSVPSQCICVSRKLLWHSTGLFSQLRCGKKHNFALDYVNVNSNEILHLYTAQGRKWHQSGGGRIECAVWFWATKNTLVKVMEILWFQLNVQSTSGLVGLIVVFPFLFETLKNDLPPESDAVIRRTRGSITLQVLRVNLVSVDASRETMQISDPFIRLSTFFYGLPDMSSNNISR